MPEFIRVRVKDTGHKIWIDPINLNDTVEELGEAPVPVPGPPVPHKNLEPALPVVDPSEQDDASAGESAQTATQSRTTAGKAGTKEGSK